MKKSSSAGGRDADHDTDRALVRRALDGEERAIQRLCQRLRCVPRILTTLNNRLRHPFAPNQLEDLMQDTFLSIWRRLDSFEGRAALESWVYRFCHHELSNRLRRERSASRHGPLEDAAEVPEEAARSNLEFDYVYAALERLPQADRITMELKHFEHLTFLEIGERLGVSPNTVKARYYRGLERLKRNLEVYRPGVER